MSNDDLSWLLKWHHSQHDRDCGHSNRVLIGTIDNPGWYLKIDLSKTNLNISSFSIININRSENNWIYCCIENRLFKGFGGPFNFPEILRIFRDWAESKNEIKK